jgi:hypothetical protein
MGGRTARKIAKTITLSMNATQQVIISAYSMISPHTKRIRSFTEGTINPAKVGVNDIAYLVPQSQQEVVEEEGGNRNCIILVVIPHAESQN